MEPVYGRKSVGASAGETWMDRFTQLEPAGGFRAAVEHAWKLGAAPSNGTALLSSLNGSARKRMAANVGVAEAA
jgi:hypothetical protein